MDPIMPLRQLLMGLTLAARMERWEGGMTWEWKDTATVG